MKRSKMVEKLAEMLPEADYEWHGGKLRFAYNVLFQLEDEGMQPPPVTCPVLFRKESKWEPETNET
jgi:hypothetical protein